MDKTPEQQTIRITPQPEIIVPRRRNPLGILVAALFVMLLGSTGYLYIENTRLQSQVARLSISPTPLPTAIPPISTPTVVPSVMWNTYNRNPNFAFQYPSDWSEQPNYSLTSSDKSMEIWVDSDTVGLTCLTKTKTVPKTVQSQNFQLEYYSGLKSCGNENKRGIFMLFRSVKASLLFTYSQSNSSDAEKLFDQILSTFKFETVTPTPMAGQQTFTNATLGFDFEYPATLGSVNLTIRNGETGRKFSGTFADNRTLRYGGISTNFTESRMGEFSDFSGYTNDSGTITYHAVRTYDKEWIIPKNLILEIYKNRNGIEIVLIRGANDPAQDGTNFPVPGTPGEGKIGALININNTEFPGVAFEVNSDFDVSQLKEILSTFRFTEN